MSENQEVEFCFADDQSLDCRVTDEGCTVDGLLGQYFGFLYINRVKWAIVMLDDGEFPVLLKAESIEINKDNWVNVKDL